MDCEPWDVEEIVILQSQWWEGIGRDSPPNAFILSLQRAEGIYLVYSLQISMQIFIQPQEVSRILPIDVNVNWGGVIFAHRLYPIFVFACGAVMAGREVEPSWACARRYGFNMFSYNKGELFMYIPPFSPYSFMTVYVDFYNIVDI